MHFHPLALGNETSPVAITLPLALEHLVADAGVSIPKALIFVFLTYVGKCPSVHDGNEYI
jgi:hypothetical protein